MTQRTRLAGLTAIGLVGALAASALLLPGPVAQAAPAFQGLIIADTEHDTGGAAGCAVADSTDGSLNQALAANGNTVTASKSSSATVTDAADLADVTEMNASTTSKASATVVAGSLSSARLSTRTRSHLDAAQGVLSACEANTTASGGLQTLFRVARPGWLRISITTTSTGPAQSQFLVAPELSDSGMFSLSMMIDSTDTRRVYLPAGGYNAIVLQQTVLATPSGADAPITDAASTLVADLVFTPGGAAPGPATGAGRTYLDLGAAVSCAPRTLTSRWKTKASAVKQAKLLVNGRAVKTVKNPRKGAAVKIGGLARDKDVTLTAVLRLRSGKTVTVARTYVSCI